MKTNFVILGLYIGFMLAFSACLNQSEPPANDKATFTNPIIADGADPWVIQHQGVYYYCFSTGDKVWISLSVNLHEIGTALPVIVWQPSSGQAYSEELWAPELHIINGIWYIYVAADNGLNENHRMYVLECGEGNPQNPFILKGKIAAPTDRWAIDGTILEQDGHLYFIWSGWEGTVNVQQNLYIAPMSNPWTISGERILISKPEFDWERNGRPLINEGPEILRKNDKIHIIYSASGSWTDDYCLGRLTWQGNSLLDRANWIKHPQPVFSRTKTVFGPGHASFVKSPDGSEDWIIYHAAKYESGGWDRNIRMQKYGWNADGNPNFGTPVTEGVELEVPAGTKK